jgi:hypothetical protein
MERAVEPGDVRIFEPGRQQIKTNVSGILEKINYVEKGVRAL